MELSGPLTSKRSGQSASLKTLLKSAPLLGKERPGAARNRLFQAELQRQRQANNRAVSLKLKWSAPIVFGKKANQVLDGLENQLRGWAGRVGVTLEE